MSDRSLHLSTGDLKGVAIAVPPQVRPTSGRVREALMNTWQVELEGARLLDLFAGSGAVGLEALGRGAAAIVGLESASRVLGQLRATYERYSGGRAEARRAVLPQELARRAGTDRFDLAFADPPYDFDRFDDLVTECATLLCADGELAIEHSSRADLPRRAGGLCLQRTRRYGESALSFYRLERGEHAAS